MNMKRHKSQKRIAGTTVFIFFIGSTVIHMLVMLINHFFMPAANPYASANLTESLLSPDMMPMMTAYGILSAIIYLLWVKIQKAGMLTAEMESEREKVDSVIRCMQRVTGRMADHIASSNAEIFYWIATRKIKGRTVSPKVEEASMRIAKAISVLSEMSFVEPYTEEKPTDLNNLEAELNKRLLHINPGGSQDRKTKT